MAKHIPACSGALQFLQDAQTISLEAVDADQEEELESYMSALDIDAQLEGIDRDTPASSLSLLHAGSDTFASRLYQAETSSTLAKGSNNTPQGLGAMRETLKAASKNVVGNSTLKEYIRYCAFVTTISLLARILMASSHYSVVNGLTSQSFVSRTTSSKMPAIWRSQLRTLILNCLRGSQSGLWTSASSFYTIYGHSFDTPINILRCDDVDVHSGQVKDLSIHRASYNMAQKMRAAMTHKFGRDFGLGTQFWTESPFHPGFFQGNPSLSVVVSQYMISLRRRKVSLSIHSLYSVNRYSFI